MHASMHVSEEHFSRSLSLVEWNMKNISRSRSVRNDNHK